MNSRANSLLKLMTITTAFLVVASANATEPTAGVPKDETEICRVLLSKVGNRPYFEANETPFEDALRNSPARIDILLNKNADGTFSLDPKYDRYRKEQLASFYDYTKGKVDAFDFVKFDQLKSESQALAYQMTALQNERIQAGLSAHVLLENPKIDRLKRITERLAGFDHPNEKLQSERDELLSQTATANLWAQYTAIRLQTEAQDEKLTELRSQYAPKKEELTHQLNRLPTDLEKQIAKTPPGENEAVFDYILRFATYNTPTNLVSLMIKTERLAGVLLAEVQVRYPKEFKAILDTNEAKNVKIKLDEITALRVEVAQLKEQIAKIPDQSKLETVTKDLEAITAAQSTIRKSIQAVASRVSSKYGLWGIIFVNLVMDWILFAHH